MNEDRTLQVLAMEYETLRVKILMCATAAINLSDSLQQPQLSLEPALACRPNGLKACILVGLAAIVLAIGVYGYDRMRYHLILLSARIAQIEDRINNLVPSRPGSPKLISWESEHQGQPLFGFLWSWCARTHI
jgi:hypothetical protein